MSSRRIHTVAIAGAAAISASLIGFAALSQSPGPSNQTRAVVLTAGDAEIYLPDLSTFTPTVAQGFPPFYDTLQGTEEWNLANSPGVIVNLDGSDTQTTIGSFVNNDFLESDSIEGGAGMSVSLPYPGSEIDLMNFGGGYESEWASLIDSDGGKTVTDTIITPFGNYTIPLGSTPPPIEYEVVSGAAAPAAGVPDGYSFAELIRSIQDTVGAAEYWFNQAPTALADGNYPLALSDDLAGINNLTVGVGNDLLTNLYAALTASDGNAGYDLQNPGQPVDIAAGLSEAQAFLGYAQEEFSQAMTDFANGNDYYGLVDLGSVATDSTSATDAIILGLFDSLIGAGVST